MDWFSWLSRTGLDPLVTYEYGLLFAGNGLDSKHIPTFNHLLLHNIGITDAKHRLIILKHAKFQTEHPNNHHKFLTRTKIYLRNCLRRLIPAKSNPVHGVSRPPAAEISPAPPCLSDDLNLKSRKHVSRSGPLDGRVHEKFVMNGSKSLKLSGPLKERPRSPRLSGPLEGRVSDWALSKSPKVNGPSKMMRLIPPCRSPRASGPLDGSPRVCCRCNKERIGTDDDYHSLWVSLFYDMKPT